MNRITELNFSLIPGLLSRTFTQTEASANSNIAFVPEVISKLKESIYFDTFSPVINWATVRIMLTLSTIL